MSRIILASCEECALGLIAGEWCSEERWPTLATGAAARLGGGLQEENPSWGAVGMCPGARGCGPARVDLLRGISRGERQQRFCPAGQALQPSLLQRPISAC